MDAFSLDAGIETSTCPTIWALRMRTSMSAMGSLMLIVFPLPACLDDAGHFALEREVAQPVPAQAELAVHAAVPAGERAAVAQPHRRRVAPQPLQLRARDVLRLVGGAGVADHLEKLRSPRLELLDGLAAFLVAEHYGKLGHSGLFQCLNGKRNALSSARASSSVFAVGVLARFMPRVPAILSYSISGKMICSLKPRL